MFDWDQGNSSHARQYEVEPSEVEEALADPNRSFHTAYSPPNEVRKAMLGVTIEGGNSRSGGAMSKVPDDEMTEIMGPEEIPHFESEMEEHRFWSTHCIGAAYAARVGRTPEEDLPFPLPPPRKLGSVKVQRKA